MRLCKVIMLAVLVGCGSTTSSVDGGTCGAALLGVTCQNSDGTCTALTCVAGQWACGTNQQQVALVPANCLPVDAGACGEVPLGVTCKNSDGSCVALTCVSGQWGCVAGQQEVALVPGNCLTADAGK
jgi:hypothetical protein